MSTALILLATGVFIFVLLFAIRQMDRAQEAALREARIHDEERRIHEVTERILAERRSKADAEKRLGDGTF